MNGLQIKATGRALPKTCVTNEEMRQYVDTSDEWISTRTGIRTRYFSRDEKNYELATKAARQAIQRADIKKEQIGACIVATITADYVTPSVACLVQRELGLATDIPVFDINAACSGFLYGLKLAERLLEEDDRPYALLIGSEQLSKILDFTDRSTCVLFGDGAAAVILQRSKDHAFYSQLGAKGDPDPLFCNGVNETESYVRMDGAKVFKFAVGAIEQGIHCMLEKSGYSMEDIDYVVCHQANKRIITHVQKKLHIPEEKFYLNLQRYGNTSSASIGLALDEMMGQGMLQPGTHIICVGFGAGFTWGSAFLEF